MPRLLSSGKGQWFLISAVIASSVFLVISVAMRNYHALDTSAASRRNEDFYFMQVEQGLIETAKIMKANFDKADADAPAGSKPVFDCTGFKKNLSDFKNYAKVTAEGLGYRADIVMDEDSSCSTKSAVIKFMALASENMMVWEGERPEVIYCEKGIRQNSFSINFYLVDRRASGNPVGERLGYDIYSEVYLYSPSGGMTTDAVEIRKNDDYFTANFNVGYESGMYAILGYIFDGERRWELDACASV